MAGELTGKTAIITGGSSGLGRAISLRFAKEGANVTVIDRTSDVVEGGSPILEELRKLGGSHEFVTGDVSDREQVDRLISGTVRRHGRLDILINNAAVSSFQPLIETDESDWDWVMGVNLKGTYFCCRAAVRQMMSQDVVNDVRGRIINMASQLGIVSARRNFAYGVSKAGVIHMTRQIAVDYAADNIVCNALAPGKIITGKPGPTVTPEAIEFAKMKTPMPRLGRPDDVASAALFLASDAASFITGHTLVVDGGWTVA